MTFQQAEVEIRALLGVANLISLRYVKDVWNKPANTPDTIECCVIWCMPDSHSAERAEAPTWQGVVDKIKRWAAQEYGIVIPDAGGVG